MPANPTNTLNLAEVCRDTRALGPGRRYAIWVQGCPFRCAGCLAVQWRSQQPKRLVPVARLAEDILNVAGLEGLTLSGGEPMLQAEACHQLIEQIRCRRPRTTLMVYTGFTLEELRAGGDAARLGLLAAVDVLIDGPYEQARNDNLGLRGSTNQRVHFLSDVYRDLGESHFTLQPRQVELHFRQEDLFMVGVPPTGLDQLIEEVTSQA